MEISQSSQLSRECKKRIREGTALAPPHSLIGLKKFAPAYQPIRRDSVVQIFPPWRKLDVFTLNSRGLLAIWTVVLLGSWYFFGIGFYEIKKITWFVSCWLGKHEPFPVLFTKNIFVKLDFRIAATNCLKCFNIYIYIYFCKFSVESSKDSHFYG